jgi:hypothetical protein
MGARIALKILVSKPCPKTDIRLICRTIAATPILNNFIALPHLPALLLRYTAARPLVEERQHLDHLPV